MTEAHTTQTEESKNGKYFFRSECNECGCLVKPDQEISEQEYTQRQNDGQSSEFICTEEGTINGYDVVIGYGSRCARCTEEDRISDELHPEFFR